MSWVASPALVSSAPATVWKYLVSHDDSAISHPRDQDYLSLRVGKGSEVELQQALAYMAANLCKREQEVKQSMVEKLIVIKK